MNKTLTAFNNPIECWNVAVNNIFSARYVREQHIVMFIVLEVVVGIF